MSRTSVTQRTEFECCYLLEDVEGVELNCHHYNVEVTVSKQADIKDAIVIKFSDLRRTIDSILPYNSYLYGYVNIGGPQIILKEAFSKIGLVPIGYPFMKITAENLVNHFSQCIQTLLDSEYPGVTLDEMKLRENGTSLTTWSR